MDQITDWKVDFIWDIIQANRIYLLTLFKRTKNVTVHTVCSINEEKSNFITFTGTPLDKHLSKLMTEKNWIFSDVGKVICCYCTYIEFLDTCALFEYLNTCYFRFIQTGAIWPHSPSRHQTDFTVKGETVTYKRESFWCIPHRFLWHMTRWNSAAEEERAQRE